MPQKTKAELESKSPTRPLKPFSGLESIDFPRRRHPDSNWGMEVLQTTKYGLISLGLKNKTAITRLQQRVSSFYD
jgi:hypothetical protein